MSDRLDTLIRNVPRKDASDDFTRGVMNRLDEAAPKETGRRWTRLAVVAALVIVALLSGVAFEKNREAQRIEAIRLEAQQLQVELDTLKKNAEESAEVYLGGTESKEYVLDLRDLTAPPEEVRTVSQSFGTN